MARAVYGAFLPRLMEFSVLHFPGSRCSHRKTFAHLNYSFQNGPRFLFQFWYQGRMLSLRRTRSFLTWCQVPLPKRVLKGVGKSFASS